MLFQPKILLVLLFSLLALFALFLYIRPLGFFCHDGQDVLHSEVKEVRIRQSLSQHVYHLAGDIGERHHENPGSIPRTIDYILSAFTRYGYSPKIEFFSSQAYQNVYAEITGIKHPEEIILIGAHYDTVWLSPGADDNASGVAVLLELANLLAGKTFDRTIRFIAFANEEQPYSEGPNMGSLVHARRARGGDEDIIAMYSLEMVGYYSSEPKSQRYPSQIAWLYPDKGNFIGFISNLSSVGLLFQSLRHFRCHSGFPVEGLSIPETWVPDIRRSDHASFWDLGYQAIMITDTSFYRNTRYHTLEDTPDTLDYLSMAKLTLGLSSMLSDLALMKSD